ncbi:hypothetical protein D9M72_425650 [compost metagenome]
MDQFGSVGPIRVGATGGAGLVRQVTALDLLEIGEDGLLDQPVWRAVDGLGNALEAVARGVVELDAESGGGHAGNSPKDWSRRRCYLVHAGRHGRATGRSL